MKVYPLEDRVVIRQMEAKKELESGIIIPDTAQRKPAKGVIVAVGPGKPGKDAPIGYMINNVFHPAGIGLNVQAEDRIVPVYTRAIKEGDVVHFAQFAGSKIDINGTEHLVMRVTDLITILDENEK